MIVKGIEMWIEDADKLYTTWYGDNQTEKDSVMLKKITQTECPHCGVTKIVSETRARQHSNGYWNEYRTFSCGLTLHFIPNFMEVRETQECKWSDDYKNKIIKRQNMIDDLRDYIDTLDADDDFKSHIK